MHRRPPLRIAGITEIPPSAPGMRIGLFGGSFNPVHAGHRLVAEQMLMRLQLDALWILVTPGNPLKSHADLASLPLRVAAARDLLAHPRIRVTGFESALGFAYSWQTVRFLSKAMPDRHFVWIMGADNLAQFHRWERWTEIAATVPIAVYVRPGAERLAPASRAALALQRYRINEKAAGTLALREAPAWVYLHGRQSNLSSSQLRALHRESAK